MREFTDDFTFPLKAFEERSFSFLASSSSVQRVFLHVETMQRHVLDGDGARAIGAFFDNAAGPCSQRPFLREAQELLLNQIA
jgi:hypothetical protein